MTTEKKKRIPKPIKTQAVETVLRYWRAISAGKDAPVFDENCHPRDNKWEWDDQKAKDTNGLFTEALRTLASGEALSGEIRKRVNGALLVLKFVAGDPVGRPRGWGFEFIQKGDSISFNDLYAGQLLFELLEAYSEILPDKYQHGDFARCSIDAFLGVCKKCKTIFERGNTRQVWCRDSCRGNQNKCKV